MLLETKTSSNAIIKMLMNIAYGNRIYPASVGGVNDYHMYIAYVVLLNK